MSHGENKKGRQSNFSLFTPQISDQLVEKIVARHVKWFLNEQDQR